MPVLIEHGLPAGSIYCLKNPNTGHVFYVGQTFSPLENRLDEHLCHAKRIKTAKDKTIIAILLTDQKPQIELLERIYGDVVTLAPILNQLEKKWIQYYNAISPLVNINLQEENSQEVNKVLKVNTDLNVTEPPENSVSKICVICQNSYYSRRKDSQACSAACRQRAHRAGIKLRATSVTPPVSEFLLPGNLGEVAFPGSRPQPITKAFMAKGGSVTLTIGKAPETPPIAPQRGYRDYLDLLKGTDYDAWALRKEIQDHKKLTGPQKSMLYAKIK